MNINKIVSNLLNIVVQKSKTNFEFLFKIMFLNKFQLIHNKQFNKTFVYSNVFYVDFSKIKITRLKILHILVKMMCIFFNKVTMKFRIMIRNEIVDNLININSLYVTCFLIWFNCMSNSVWYKCAIFKQI